MAASNFAAALDIVLRFEGGYVDHPADPGGATNLGITRATLEQWRGQAVSKADVRALTRQEAAAIYRARYWNAVRGDEMPAGLDLALFDLAVNSGPSRAVRLLQRALGQPENGRLSPRVLQGVLGQEATALIRALGEARLAFLRELKTFPVFGRGWQRRVAGIERAALAMARHAAAPSSSPQEKTMDTTKSILSSRTLWANGVGLLALGLSAAGFNTSGLDAGVLTDRLFEAVAAGSFIISSVFRVLATKRLNA